MFAGIFRYRVDAKGRLAIPARFRDDLRGAHLSIGPDAILAIYTAEEFERLMATFKPALQADEDGRRVSRTIWSMATPVEFDAQGRLTLNADQRRVSGIEINSSVAVIGNGHTVEIWPEERWDSYFAGAQPQFTELVNKVSQA